MTTISSWLKQAQTKLEAAGIDTARLDCLVLLADQLGRDKSWLLSHPEYELQESEIEILNTRVIQRAQHVPLAYIRGHAEFYGREFIVNAHTLVPRPETESMIELLKSLRLPADARILDVGTGSGCIAITVALELPDVHVSACDIDTNCLQIAQQNANTLDAKVTFLESDLLANTHQTYDVILANLPYVPDNFQINTAATHEPRHALFGGRGGLDLYRRMFNQITARMEQAGTKSPYQKPRYILTESLPPQHETLERIAKAAGYSLQQTNDFIQLFAI